jgi:hypothetical protein
MNGSPRDLRWENAAMVRTCEISRAACSANCRALGRAIPAGMKATAGIDHGRENGHRMGAGRKALEMVFHVLMQIFMLREKVGEFSQFRLGRQLSVDDQIGGFDEPGFDGQFLDGNAAITQDALLAVDESDGALAGAGVGVTVVQRDVTGGVAQAGNVHRNWQAAKFTFSKN